MILTYFTVSFPKIFVFCSGLISGLVFAPTFLFPALISFSFLCYQITICKNYRQAAMFGYIFGFGHFLASMYWISIGVSVYINEFWWAIPLALFGLPAILAFFIAASCALSFFARNNNYYQLVFCVYWVFFEWVRSWIFTGLPWNLIGYAFSFSDILVQVANIVGIYGLSFFVLYVATSFHSLLAREYYHFKIAFINAVVIILIISIYGKLRLDSNPTNFLDIKVRLVQPSIPQIAKWDAEELAKNLALHVTLSEQKNPVDLIIWSEAALVLPYKHRFIQRHLLPMLRASNAILISGGISDNDQTGDELEIYTSMYAIGEGNKLFEYHKAHLVPFGEYMPLKNFLPLKKLTPGFLDYTQGIPHLVRLEKFNLTIKPLICYESIFPNFVRISNREADLIINVTNDSWYGHSSGPYQHFHISRMRSIENGLPMLRVANNGISAIIDPVGRVIAKLSINKVSYIDGLVPTKLKSHTLYSQLGDISMLITIIVVLIINYLIKNLINRLNPN